MTNARFRIILAGAALVFSSAPRLRAQNLVGQAEEAYRSGDPDRAAALARKALAANPASVQANLIAGLVAARRSQWAEASRYFLAVRRIEPANPFSYFYLGQASLYRGDWEKAIREFSAALERGYPDRDRLLVELALAQSEAGQPAGALASLQRVAPPERSWPYAAEYHAVRGFALAKTGRGAEALESMRRARDLDASNPQYAEFLVSTLIAANRNAAALEEALGAQRHFPDHAGIQFLFGLSSYYVTQGGLTRLALRNLREIGAAEAKIFLLSGLVSRQEGKAEEAAEAFRKAAQAGVPDAHLLLGLVHRDAGDLAAAEREFLEAEKANPASGQALLELGKALLGRGDLAGAKARLERAADVMPSTAAVHYQLSILYGRLREKEKSQRSLQRYRDLEAADRAAGVKPAGALQPASF
jgi:tetratricopeptide (TPR) repeat protein